MRHFSPAQRAAIDELGRIRDRISRLRIQEQAAWERVAALGKGEHAGHRYCAMVCRYSRSVLDLDAARKKLGDAWCRRHSRRVPVTSVTTYPAAR